MIAALRTRFARHRRLIAVALFLGLALLATYSFANRGIGPLAGHWKVIHVWSTAPKHLARLKVAAGEALSVADNGLMTIGRSGFQGIASFGRCGALCGVVAENRYGNVFRISLAGSHNDVMLLVAEASGHLIVAQREAAQAKSTSAR